MQERLPSKLVVFDLETVPDIDMCAALTGCQSVDVNILRESMEQYHLEITNGNNAFLRQPFHKIVSLGYMQCDIVRHAHNKESYVIKYLGCARGGDEEEILRNFLYYIDTNKPRLISFNGRMFDMPVIKYRAMRYGLSCGALYDVTNKWDNYGSRYSRNWHCDLLEVLSDYGASARVRLNEVCVSMGLPGKIGVDGSKVTALYDENRIKEIDNYCQTDVLNTYLVYLRTMLHYGEITKDSYISSVKEVIKYINDSKDELHLQEFLHEWRNQGDLSCDGQLIAELFTV